MPDYALMNQYLYEGKAKEVEQMTKDALAQGLSRRVGPPNSQCILPSVTLDWWSIRRRSRLRAFGVCVQRKSSSK